MLKIPKCRFTDSRSQRVRASRESGMAAGELLVLTIPMCVLSMAISSKFAATSSAHTQGQWHTALSAQQQTTGPCPADTDLVMTAPLAMVLKKKNASKALVPMLPTMVPIPGVSDPMALVGKKRAEEATPIPGYYYQPHADRAVPSGAGTVTSSSTFVCNEPNHGDKRATLYEVYLGLLGAFQAAKLFGVTSGGASDPSANLPAPPDPCNQGGKSSTGGPDPCDEPAE